MDPPPEPPLPEPHRGDMNGLGQQSGQRCPCGVPGQGCGSLPFPAPCVSRCCGRSHITLTPGSSPRRPNRAWPSRHEQPEPVSGPRPCAENEAGFGVSVLGAAPDPANTPHTTAPPRRHRKLLVRAPPGGQCGLGGQSGQSGVCGQDGMCGPRRQHGQSRRPPAPSELFGAEGAAASRL